MSIKTSLIEEFESQMKELSKLEVGSEQYKVAVDGVTKMADRIIEIDRDEQEAILKRNANVDEYEIKASQLESENRDRLIRNAIEGVKVGGGFGLAIWAYITSMKYEAKGLIPTTEGGRAALRSLFKIMK